MKHLIRYGWLLAMLLVPAAAMAQEVKVVTVNTEQAVLKCEAGKQANLELTAKYEEKTKEFDAKKKKLEENKEKILNQGPLMNAEARTTLINQTKDLESQFTRGLEDTDRELDLLRHKLLDPIIKAARAELDKLVLEKNYDLVLDVSIDPGMFIYTNPKIDITDDLVKRIDGSLKTSAGDLKPATSAEIKPAKP